MSRSVVLVHGGLWDAMDAEAFWGTTGITGGLTSEGLKVLAPDRPRRPSGWDDELAALGELLANRDEPLTIVGASNGCTVAVLLALSFPHLVDHLLLAWPATAGDPAVDTRTRAGLIEDGCPPDAADALLAGETLRGVTDADLARLSADADASGPMGAGDAGPAPARISVAVVGSVPENPAHQRTTVDALLRLIRGSRELAGCPEPPTPGFPPYLDRLVRTIVEFVN
jgi:pimeloyl-ACP methyl ester carboxylesterase